MSKLLHPRSPSRSLFPTRIHSGHPPPVRMILILASLAGWLDREVLPPRRCRKHSLQDVTVSSRCFFPRRRVLPAADATPGILSAPWAMGGTQAVAALSSPSCILGWAPWSCLQGSLFCFHRSLQIQVSPEVLPLGMNPHSALPTLLCPSGELAVPGS